MSTNADIIVQRNDGKFAVIYSHYDGYVSWNGVRLLKYYNTQLNAEALVELGDMKQLEARPDHIAGHTMNTPAKNHSTYFGRDDRRKQCEYKLYATMSEALEAAHHEYTYLWLRDHESWYVAKANEEDRFLLFADFEVLAQAILGAGDPHDAREAWNDLPDYDEVGHREDGYGLIPAHRMPEGVEIEFDPSTVPYSGGWA